jgi:hypothetical protein
MTRAHGPTRSRRGNLLSWGFKDPPGVAFNGDGLVIVDGDEPFRAAVLDGVLIVSFGPSTVVVGEHCEGDETKAGDGFGHAWILGVTESVKARPCEGRSGSDPHIGQVPTADRWWDDAIKSGAVDVLQQEHGVAACDEDESARCRACSTLAS